MADVDSILEAGMFPDSIIKDLDRSGLTPSDMKIRPMGPNEAHTLNAPQGSSGYIIPYFTPQGRALDFYRARLFDAPFKYKQVANTSNHIYYPPGFWERYTSKDCKAILFVEGEKKAAAAVKLGYAAVAVGGTDSWRNRLVQLPKGVQLAQGGKGAVVAKLAAGSEAQEKIDSLAEGMEQLLALLEQRKIPLVIIYDTDQGVYGVKFDVQRAAAVLGYHLRHKGIPMKNVRQLVLKPSPSYMDDKLALDDYFEHESLGPKKFAEALAECLAKPTAFPRHPNPREYVNKKLQQTRMPRSEMQALATAVVSELDARGRRLYCPDDDSLYYFDALDKELIPVTFRIDENYPKSDFGIKLYRDYNLSQADARLIQWINTQFVGEQPISEVTPERVIAVRGDSMYYQLSDGRMARITEDSIDLVDNGTDNVLFLAGSVEPMDELKLESCLESAKKAGPQNYWIDVLKEARIAGVDADKVRQILSLLYSLSPFYYRWRGTQLPVEMVIAEPGAGKSTLFTLRLNILSGKPKLRNAPSDLRDWTASVAATGGLHVTDNMHMTNNSLRQELSDEICRVITEPDPKIERRKLYSDNELVETPVRTVFAVTAIQQPFVNADIIQRSFIIHLDKGTETVTYDGDWATVQLERFGGREGWMANQMVFMQTLLKKLKAEWDPKYKARYRLINMEQLFLRSAEVYGFDGSWIPDFIDASLQKTVSDTDFALQGLRQFIMDYGGTPFTARDISEWAEADEEYKKCIVLANSRSITTYLTKHKNMLAQMLGIYGTGRKHQNRDVFMVIPPKESTSEKYEAVSTS